MSSVEVGGEALDRREDGDFGLVGDELRGHLGREGIGDLPIGGDAAARSAGVIAHAVVDVEPDQLVGHVGAGGGVHRVADRAVRLAQDLPLPDQSMSCWRWVTVKWTVKRSSSCSTVRSETVARDGVPVAIADGDVDALRDLSPPKRTLRRSRPTSRAVTGPAWRGRGSSGGSSRPYHHWNREIGVVALIAARNSFLCWRLSAIQFSGGCEQLGYRPDPVR